MTVSQHVYLFFHRCISYMSTAMFIVLSYVIVNFHYVCGIHGRACLDPILTKVPSLGVCARHAMEAFLRKTQESLTSFLTLSHRQLI